MFQLSRRSFLETAACGLAAGLGSVRKTLPLEAGAPAKPKVALVHATDLFRPHADPDDHFDLASAYALAVQGRLELLAVLIDHPPANFGRDPDVLAVAQMNRITGLSVPIWTGAPRRLDPAEALGPGHREAAGAMALLRALRESELPVAITVVGSSRDVALAGRLEPKLFAAKCAGIYLNAGSGTPDKAKAARLEYNVSLDPASYAAIFDIPCPLYWLPCFEVVPGPNEPFTVGEYGTYYRFLQKDVLPHLSRSVQNYFAFMFKQGESDQANQTEPDALRPNWLRYLEGPREEVLLERQGARFRNMWSTPGFLHAAGLTVTMDGRLEALHSAASSVYSFDPIRVRCGPDGVTEWSPDPSSRQRFLFHVRNTARYPGAMMAALRAVLSALP